jgi:hypothetical protein
MTTHNAYQIRLPSVSFFAGYGQHVQSNGIDGSAGMDSRFGTNGGRTAGAGPTPLAPCPGGPGPGQGIGRVVHLLDHPAQGQSPLGFAFHDDDDDDDKYQPSRDELVVEVEDVEAAVAPDVSTASVRSANRSVQVYC